MLILKVFYQYIPHIIRYTSSAIFRCKVKVLPLLYRLPCTVFIKLKKNIITKLPYAINACSYLLLS